MKNFKKGTVVVFDPESFNKDFWKNLSEEDKIKYYGSLGYGTKQPMKKKILEVSFTQNSTK